MGFAEDDISRLTDRLVDALVAPGDVHSIIAEMSECCWRAGADPPESLPISQWR